jgi:uncharacterized membrane protein YhaH (DUF805 family)
MWFVRELLRLVGRIAVAVLIAIVIAEVRAILSGGDTFHTFRIVLSLLGALMLLLAAAPAASLGGRRMNDISWRLTQSMGFGFRSMQEAPGPKLTANAVFVGSGVVLLALGAVL